MNREDQYMKLAVNTTLKHPHIKTMPSRRKVGASCYVFGFDIGFDFGFGVFGLWGEDVELCRHALKHAPN
jgi:hypothetical protein